MKQKSAYRLHNWSEYNKSLVARGSITLWIAPEVEGAWLAEPCGTPGRPNTYGDLAIVALAVIRVVYRLPLRAACGFVASIFERAKIRLPVPEYTTVCRRLKHLHVDLAAVRAGGAVDVVVDSTGLKVYGEGEWKVRKHGAGKRRTWRKLHLAGDAGSWQILGVSVSANDVADCDRLEDLLAQIEEPIASVLGDGAYDGRWNRFIVHERGAKAVIPPPRNARPSPETGGGARERNEAIARIAEVGRKAWKIESGYHVRSRAETQMFRVKTIFGERLRSREEKRQENEVRLRVRALNVMTALGMPDSYAVTKRAA